MLSAYRLSYDEKKQVKDIITDLKKADVIEDSSFQYPSPILLVRKKMEKFECVPTTGR